MKNSNQTLGYFAGLYSGMSWGLATVLLGILMATSVFTTNQLFIVYGVYLCCMLQNVFSAGWIGGYLCYKKAGFVELKKVWGSRELRYCLLGALLGGPIAMTLYLKAIVLATSSATAIVTAIYPILGAVLARFLLNEYLDRKAWLGLALCVLGVAVLGYTSEQNQSTNFVWGILCALGAAVGWASEGVVCAYGMKKGEVTPETALFFRELTSGITYGIIVLPLLAGGYGVYVDFIQYLISDANYVVWVMIGIALVGMSSFLMWYTAINKIGASRALCLNVSYAFWTVVFAVILGQTSLSWTVLIGALMVVSGVFLNFLNDK